MESPTHSFKSSFKNRALKVKLCWVVACKRKNRAFFVPFIFSNGNFFNISVLSQCIVYWIHFQNIHTLTDRKILLYTLFSLFLKSPKAFSVSLNKNREWKNITVMSWCSWKIKIKLFWVTQILMEILKIVQCILDKIGSYTMKCF